MDFELKPVHHKNTHHKNNSKYSSKMHQQLHEVSFVSYGDSLKQLSTSLFPSEKDKFSNLFDIFTHNQKSQNILINQSFIINNRHNIHNTSNIKKQRKSKSKLQQNQQSSINQLIDGSKKSSNRNSNLQSSIISEQDAQFQVKEFTHEQRQSLKNAFRYICRLVFKQAHKYEHMMTELLSNKQKFQYKTNLYDQKTHTKKYRRQKSSLSITQSPTTLSQLNLLQQAELISGQRYFKQFLQKLQLPQQKILLNYMIWFLKVKYLRYINKCNNENKGKRKQMKKDLYIRFKNNIMLPYLQDLLMEIKT